MHLMTEGLKVNFVKGNQYRFLLPEDMEEFPCLPLSTTKAKITSIPKNAILVFHTIQKFAFAQAAIFELADWGESGQKFYISLEAAERYCFKIRKRK